MERIKRPHKYIPSLALWAALAYLLQNMDSLMGLGIASHNRMQMASTTRLFAGEDAGEPADMKHLQQGSNHTDRVVIQQYLFMTATSGCPDLVSLVRANRHRPDFFVLGSNRRGFLSNSWSWSKHSLILAACTAVTARLFRSRSTPASLSTFPQPDKGHTQYTHLLKHMSLPPTPLESSASSSCSSS